MRSTIISVEVPASLAEHIRGLAAAITTADAKRQDAVRAADHDGPPDKRAASLIEAVLLLRERDECARELGIHLAASVAAA